MLDLEEQVYAQPSGCDLLLLAQAIRFAGAVRVKEGGARNEYCRRMEGGKRWLKKGVW
jgi:hypothetical protein